MEESHSLRIGVRIMCLQSDRTDGAVLKENYCDEGSLKFLKGSVEHVTWGFGVKTKTTIVPPGIKLRLVSFLY